ncbi:MAG: hypothetical protein K2W85_13090 [Phycisphaerales bacterium]|nr:hypothetical protein [Phycisphaerales bacterium]
MTYLAAQLHQLTRRTTACVVAGLDMGQGTAQAAVWQKLCQTTDQGKASPMCMDRQIHAFPGGASVSEVQT